MNCASAMKTLKAEGKEITAKIYARHGVTQPCYGVSYAVLKKLTKDIGRDQDLADQLWTSGIHDARVLATMVADPEKITRKTIQSWLKDSDNYVLNDGIAGVAARMTAGELLAQQWVKSPREWRSAAGWNVYSLLSLEGRLSEKSATGLLTHIVVHIHDAPNRTRHSMNGALISIGGSMESLQKNALAAAKKIGRVEVDHGETSCKTPDAAGYIKKMKDRKSHRSRITASRAGA